MKLVVWKNHLVGQILYRSPDPFSKTPSEKYFIFGRMSKSPLRVVVTGAAGQISYSLLALIAKGDVFGNDQPVDLVMLDLAFAADAMKGVEMELQVIYKQKNQTKKLWTKKIKKLFEVNFWGIIFGCQKNDLVDQKFFLGSRKNTGGLYLDDSSFLAKMDDIYFLSKKNWTTCRFLPKWNFWPVLG